ncbi:MAG: hypothetical protein L0216_12420 [Planctomycetales bacterium]|nr:hypothetical protein [Planctomycetales bacterium]
MFAGRRLLSGFLAGMGIALAAASGTARADEGGSRASVEPTLAAEIRWWWLALDGDLRVSDLDPSGEVLRGTLLEFGSEYDLDTRVGTPEAVARLSLGGSVSVLAGYFEVGSDGNEQLRRGVSYGGRTYTAGEWLSTALDLRYARAALSWMPLDLLGVRAGAMVGAAWLRFDATVADDDGRTRARGEAPFPCAGLAARVALADFLFVRGDVSGLAGSYGDLRGLWLDGSLAAHLVPVRNVTIGGGVRALHVDVEELDLGRQAWAEGRFTLFGVYAVVEIRI